MKITFLGPAGATFTAVAYDSLGESFGTPLSTDPSAELVLTKDNKDVVELVLGHGGYGAIAMETEAEGKIDPPTNSFIALARTHNGNCPLQILGALRMKINFALMARPDVSLGDITKVLGHAKAFGACQGRLKVLGVPFVDSPSNGKAAEDIASQPELAKAAALGPKCAAEKYGLNVLDRAFEDRQAITTFFLLGPRQHRQIASDTYRSLLVFQTKDKPGALVEVQIPFRDEEINMNLIHSLYRGNREYDFAIGTECSHVQLANHKRAMKRVRGKVKSHILFGPFPVLSI